MRVKLVQISREEKLFGSLNFTALIGQVVTLSQLSLLGNYYTTFGALGNCKCTAWLDGLNIYTKMSEK